MLKLEVACKAVGYKVSHKMSYADAFAAALARIKKAELVTGDLAFKGPEKEIKIHWLSRK